MSHCGQEPRRFFGDPTLLARDNIFHCYPYTHIFVVATIVVALTVNPCCLLSVWPTLSTPFYKTMIMHWDQLKAKVFCLFSTQYAWYVESILIVACIFYGKQISYSFFLNFGVACLGAFHSAYSWDFLWAQGIGLIKNNHMIFDSCYMSTVVKSAKSLMYVFRQLIYVYTALSL